MPGHLVPPEEDVAGALDQALALDHPLAHVGVLARLQERLGHRVLGLLDLQDQRVAVVPADEQGHPAPGARPSPTPTTLRARSTNWYRLSRCWRSPGQRGPVVGRAPASRLLDRVGGVVGVEELVDRGQQRRVGPEPQLPVHLLGQLGHRPQVVLALGLLRPGSGSSRSSWCRPRPPIGSSRVSASSRRYQRSRLRIAAELPDRLAVALGRQADQLACAAVRRTPGCGRPPRCWRPGA